MSEFKELKEDATRLVSNLTVEEMRELLERLVVDVFLVADLTLPGNCVWDVEDDSDAGEATIKRLGSYGLRPVSTKTTSYAKPPTVITNYPPGMTTAASTPVTAAVRYEAPPRVMPQVDPDSVPKSKV